MKLIPSGQSRLKIYLDEAESLKLRQQSPSGIKQSLLTLLDKARAQAGFYHKGACLIAELLPAEFGCVIIITAVYGIKITPGRSRLLPNIYSFKGSVQLCAALLGLYRNFSGRVFHSGLYHWRGEYRLIIKALDYLDRHCACFLSEFSQPLGGEILAEHIREHGEELIASRAIELLGGAIAAAGTK